MVLGGVFTLSQLKLTRNLLLGVKDQGEGPSQAERDEACFTVVMQAQSTQHKLSTKISGGDPGYTETSKMLAEAALCLVLDKELPDVAGVITPAMAMGNSLITRLQSKGIKFEVTEAS